MGGGINLELLARLQSLENEVSGLRQELTQVQQSRGGEDYGLVKLTSSSTVTDSTGLAMPASENNSSNPGSLANRINVMTQKLTDYIQIKYVESTDFTVGPNEQYNGNVTFNVPAEYKMIGFFTISQAHGVWTVYSQGFNQINNDCVIYYGVFSVSGGATTGRIAFNALIVKK